MGIISNMMEYEDLKFRPKNSHGHNGIFFHDCILFYWKKYKNVKFNEGYVSICVKPALRGRVFDFH